MRGRSVLRGTCAAKLSPVASIHRGKHGLEGSGGSRISLRARELESEGEAALDFFLEQRSCVEGRAAQRDSPLV